MADVFLAVQPGPVGSRIRKLSVVKRLRQNLAEDPEFIAMLVDEARIASRLNHPNVVQTHEVDSVGEQYFIAMEYLDGQPFHRVQQKASKLRAQGKNLLPPDEQYIVLMDALAGLHHAHTLLDFDDSPLGIVHRDMTPHNVFVTYDGQVKVVDFGIAKAAGRSSETRQGVVKGKVRYMAPEQAIGQTVDRRTDVFAAGIMLWEMATGRRLWNEMDDFQIVQALVEQRIPSSPREANPEVPEEIDAICRRALSPKMEGRYSTAHEFRDDLESYLGKTGALISARKRLTGSLNELFREKRIELRLVIEQQLEALDEELVREAETNGGRHSLGSLPKMAASLSSGSLSGAGGTRQSTSQIVTLDAGATGTEATVLTSMADAGPSEGATLVMSSGGRMEHATASKSFARPALPSPVNVAPPPVSSPRAATSTPASRGLPKAAIVVLAMTGVAAAIAVGVVLAQMVGQPRGDAPPQHSEKVR